jgi:two-component system, NarL family, response regulator
LTSVIVVTASESAENGVRAIRLGARAVVQKRFAIETLMVAIRAVAEGLVWMPPAVQAQFAMEASSSKQLTPRETEIVRHVANGMRNAQVAQSLSISESTVKTHLNKVFQKLNLRDRVQLIRYALKTGLARHPDHDR